MTPKERAEHLLNIMSKQTYQYQPYAGARYLTEEIGYEAGKQCALIALDEIYRNNTDIKKNDYWCDVKEELEKL